VVSGSDLQVVRVHRQAPGGIGQVESVKWFFVALIPEGELPFSTSNASNRESLGVILNTPNRVIRVAVGNVVANELGGFPFEADHERLLDIAQRVCRFV